MTTNPRQKDWLVVSVRPTDPAEGGRAPRRAGRPVPAPASPSQTPSGPYPPLTFPLSTVRRGARFESGVPSTRWVHGGLRSARRRRECASTQVAARLGFERPRFAFSCPCATTAGTARVVLPPPPPDVEGRTRGPDSGR